MTFAYVRYQQIFGEEQTNIRPATLGRRRR
jgi:hypothetical protein